MNPPASSTRRARGFTLIEVALVVAIIGMIMLIIVGYLLAPKKEGPLPPVAATTPIRSASGAPPAAPPPPPAPATPAPIELSPQGTPLFR